MGKKLTLEECKERLRIINENVEIISDKYLGAKNKLNLKCKICDHIWSTSYESLSRKRGCPRCTGVLKLTIEDVKVKMSSIDNTIEILSNEYSGNKVNLKCKCKICGNEFEKPWSKLNSSRKACSICDKKLKEENKMKELRKEFKNINKDIEIIDFFKKGTGINKSNFKYYANCRCLVDSYEWETNIRKLRMGRGCPKCGGTAKLTLEEVKERTKGLNPNIKILSDTYINAKTKLDCVCLVCGHKWGIRYLNILNGCGCPVCAIESIKNKAKLTLDEVKEKLKVINPSLTIIDDTYINNRIKLLCRCEKCSYEWSISWSNILNGYGCPSCCASKGEKKIYKHLINKDVKFEPQKTCQGLLGLGGGNLSYDFYLPDYNLLIEYQGEFHDGKGSNYTKINIKRQKEHDRRKKEYAKNNDIDLLEIWYWDFDRIEDILEKTLQSKKQNSLVKCF